MNTHRDQCRSSRRGRRATGGFAAAAAIGLGLTVLPSSGTAVAEEKAAEPAFAGYSTTTSASPLKVELYEAAIPIPADPQLEVSLGYSGVTADTASARAKASYLWPGAPVGEGLKTILAQLGLPAELGQDYPIQVTAIHPDGPAQDADEPAPGMVQRAVVADRSARADNGSSTDGEVGDDEAATDDADEDADDAATGPIPGLPALPGLSGLPGLVSEVLGGEAAAPAAAPLPAPLAALVDVGSFSSTARYDADDERVLTRSRARVGDVSLLGGLVTIDAVETFATTTSDGKSATSDGRATYGTVTALGQRFRFGPDGFEAAGNQTPIPLLPDAAPAALKQLGITITVPKAERVVSGAAASSVMPGLAIELDLTVLRRQLGPLGVLLTTLTDQVPAEAGQLKSYLDSAARLSPRIRFILGTSDAEVETSEPIVVPPAPEPTEEATSEAPAPAGGGGTSSGSGGTTTSTSPVGSGPVDVAPTDVTPVSAEAVNPVSSEPVPGLPPLLSFPGLLLYGGLLGAAVAGFFTRRLGLAALGGTGSCAHGLDSGLPDLRKVT